jgi:NitT/TauT family transport system substrate-binding protein
MKKWVVLLSLVTMVLFCYCNKAAQKGTMSEVKVMLSWDPGPENAFLYYGMDQGIFKKYQIELKVIPSKGSSLVATALLNRTVDFGFLSSDYLLTTRTKTPSLKAVCVLYHQTPVTIYSPVENNIKEPNDLKGKRLGVLTYSAAYPQVVGFLKMKNVSGVIEVPSRASVSELLAGQIDAAMDYTNYAPVLMVVKEKRPVNEILLSQDENIRLYGTSISADESTLNNRRELAERFVHAVLESLEEAKSNHAGALAALLKHSPELDRSVEELALQKTESMIYSPETLTKGVGYMDSDGWKKSIDTLIHLGALNTDLAVTSVFDDRFLQTYRSELK